ncbi:MAG: hypothetical protein H6818_21190 [Phycisphaerales bacterium]|nr:hypothetical protein [Phycisphaerales bacterium]MCB9862308.1 hypothetical protein [Phycisphaerales bacterium]
MTLEITSLESQLVVDLIRHELSEIPSEVRRTQTSTYREDLKTREQALRDLLKKFSNEK